MELHIFKYKINRIFSLVTAVLFVSICTHAQSVVIKGKVIDDQKSPLELAQVRVEGTAFGAVCNLK
ncbi:MAG: hypothetical protein IJ804_06055, partial [Prevotella sp.]|nr:hypothetical protein [Prevotella sp.]